MRLPSESKQQLFLKNLFSENAILFSGLGIFLAVAGTVTVTQAFFLSAITLFLVTGNSLACSLVGELFQKKIPLWTLCLGTALVLSLSLPLFSDTFVQLPEHTRLLYLALSLSPLTYSRAQTFAHSTTPERAMFDAFGTGLGIMLVMVLISALREAAGRGSLAGWTVLTPAPWPLASSMLGGMALTAAILYLFNHFFRADLK